MRVKRGFTSKRRHNAMLKEAQGFRGRRKSCYKLAKDAVQRAWKFSYRDRKVRKRDFRALWNIRINAAARELGLSYSRFICGLKSAGVEVNRKVLADLAVSDPAAFAAVADQAKTALRDRLATTES